MPGSTNEENSHYGHDGAQIPRSEATCSLPLHPAPAFPMPSATEQTAEHMEPPLRTRAGSGDSRPEQAADLPVFGSHGVHRRKSLRTRQSSEDVYFSKSGELQPPPCLSLLSPRPP